VAKEVGLLELHCHVVPQDISTLLANRSYSSYTKVEKSMKMQWIRTGVLTTMKYLTGSHLNWMPLYISPLETLERTDPNLTLLSSPLNHQNILYHQNSKFSCQ
jgi:hypothetical protein